jgi:hypothetical protein
MVNILLAEIGYLDELAVPGVIPDLAGKTIYTQHATYLPLFLQVHGIVAGIFVSFSYGLHAWIGFIQVGPGGLKGLLRRDRHCVGPGGFIINQPNARGSYFGHTEYN